MSEKGYSADLRLCFCVDFLIIHSESSEIFQVRKKIPWYVVRKKIPWYACEILLIDNKVLHKYTIASFEITSSNY